MLSKTLPNDARLGAQPLPDGDWHFLVWAPHARSVALQLCGRDELVPMDPLDRGYYQAICRELQLTENYFLHLDNSRSLPDPASRFQPQGVHGPSQIVDTRAFPWTDQDWKGRELRDSIFYELHVGTYTSEGTFDALIPHLPKLADLGITTIELMPIAQFPGSRNWGYDGTYEFAPQNSYGGPQSLQRFVNSAHAHGLAVALDVVYNHLGPEGNYLNTFGPYFTDRYRTPWGQAINFDGQGSDEVRRFFMENALYWLEDYHFDALRLDAIHGIFDFSASPFLAELKKAVNELAARLGRPLHLIAESDLNDSRVLRDSSQGGFNLDAQWSDDFHHSVHTLLTKENRGYYEDFGGVRPLVETLKNGWYYAGQYSAHRQRRHGNSPRGIAPTKFVAFSQNHDQVGNRAAGERLSSLVDFESLKLAAGITLLSPFVPLLFMGEEYGETAPFQYFTSHGDPALVEAVRLGRREEFAAFGWQANVPDPQDEDTYSHSHLNHQLREEEPHDTLFRFYRRLIRLRKELKVAAAESRRVHALGDSAVLLEYFSSVRTVRMILNFAEFPVTLEVPELAANGTLLLDSAEVDWNDPNLPSPDATSRHLFPGRAGSARTTNPELRLTRHSFLVFEQVHAKTEPA